MIMGELRGGQTIGCIAPKEESKPHKCNTPLTWFRKTGTLYRCECGEVYKLSRFHDSFNGLNIASWDKSTIEEWIEAGGTRR